MKLKSMFVLVLVSLLTGCLSPVKTNTTTSYVVNQLPHDVATSKRHRDVLLVLSPDARPIYQTIRMAYTSQPYQIKYFGENQWAETPSQMLEALLVQTLQNTRRFRGVVVAPYTGHETYQLNTQILRFEQDFLHHPHAFKLDVQFSINRSSTSQLIASKAFSISAPLSQETPYGGVIAANMAVKRLLKQVAKFVVQNT